MSHIEIVNGQAMMKGRPLKVRMVAEMYLKAGASIEAVMEQYNLTQAEVHAALAYYYDNQAAFQQAEREARPLLDAARKESETRLKKMRARARELKSRE